MPFSVKRAGEVVCGEIVHIADKVIPDEILQRLPSARNIRAGIPRVEDGEAVIPVVGTDTEIRLGVDEGVYVKRRSAA